MYIHIIHVHVRTRAGTVHIRVCTCVHCMCSRHAKYFSAQCQAAAVGTFCSFSFSCLVSASCWFSFCSRCSIYNPPTHCYRSIVRDAPPPHRVPVRHSIRRQTRADTPCTSLNQASDTPPPHRVRHSISRLTRATTPCTSLNQASDTRRLTMYVTQSVV